jgi:hypothetical protein
VPGQVHDESGKRSNQYPFMEIVYSDMIGGHIGKTWSIGDNKSSGGVSVREELSKCILKSGQAV